MPGGFAVFQGECKDFPCGRWLSMLSLVPLALLPLVGLWLARMAALDGMTGVHYEGNHTNWKFYRPGRILLDLLVHTGLWAFALATAGLALDRTRQTGWMFALGALGLVGVFLLHGALID